MDTALKAEFVAELRSGKYLPTQGEWLHLQMKDDSELFCPLGVLCEMAARAGATCPKVEPSTYDDIGLPPGVSAVVEYKDSDGVLYPCMPPFSVMEWAQLDYPDVRPVMEMFDSGATFSEVADYVEAEW